MRNRNLYLSHAHCQPRRHESTQAVFRRLVASCMFRRLPAAIDCSQDEKLAMTTVN